MRHLRDISANFPHPRTVGENGSYFVSSGLTWVDSSGPTLIIMSEKGNLRLRFDADAYYSDLGSPVDVSQNPVVQVGGKLDPRSMEAVCVPGPLLVLLILLVLRLLLLLLRLRRLRRLLRQLSQLRLLCLPRLLHLLRQLHLLLGIFDLLPGAHPR